MKKTRVSSRRRSVAVVVTCEHGGNEVPPEYRHLFAGQEDRICSHEGYDRGAFVLARTLSSDLKCPLIFSTTTRLLVDLNRSLSNPRVFSNVTKACPEHIRDDIIEGYYYPYHRRVVRIIGAGVRKASLVIHVSAHTFSPVLGDKIREADIGLLYDPKRSMEREFSVSWRSNIRVLLPKHRIRMNYPYRGVSDGLTKMLRAKFDEDNYVGIELEAVNSTDCHIWSEMAHEISRAAVKTVAEVKRR